MENTAENCRRIPPRSKFNDEESTAVFRLMVEQERLLKKGPINPVLNITSDKLKRLPPLNASLPDPLDCGAFEQQRNQRRYKSNEEIVLTRPTLLKAKEARGMSLETATFGRPKVPDIFSTPKIARPRERERPRAAYGRNAQNRCKSEMFTRTATSAEGTFHSNAATPEDVVLDRPSNPTPFIEHDLRFNEKAWKNSFNRSIYDESDDDDMTREETALSLTN